MLARFMYNLEQYAIVLILQYS